jgi:para-nitrobenzyl esterase
VNGKQAAVPYLAGANSYEIGFAPEAMRKPFTAILGMALGPAQADVKAAYGSDAAYEQNLAGDLMFNEPARFLAGLTATNGSWLYLFDYVPEAKRASEPGAVHGSEVSYVFGTNGAMGELVSDADRAMAKLMGDYWVAFAKAGDPNGGGHAVWPRYRTAEPVRLRLGAAGAVPESAALPALDVLAKIADTKREAASRP